MPHLTSGGRGSLELGASQLTLAKLIGLLAGVGDFTWRLLRIEGVGNITPLGTSMLDLEKRAAETPGGIEVSWQWLDKLANLLDDLINLKLEGAASSGASNHRRTLLVSLHDSSYWTIEAEPDLLDALRRAVAAAD